MHQIYQTLYSVIFQAIMCNLSQPNYSYTCAFGVEVFLAGFNLFDIIIYNSVQICLDQFIGVNDFK